MLIFTCLIMEMFYIFFHHKSTAGRSRTKDNADMQDTSSHAN